MNVGDKEIDYVALEGVRKSTAQDIIDSFLCDDFRWPCHLCNHRFGIATLFTMKRADGVGRAFGFGSVEDVCEIAMRKFHECEMREAFRILIENGYHMFKVWKYGDEITGWPGYVCEKDGRCRYPDGVEVTTFTEQWD